MEGRYGIVFPELRLSLCFRQVRTSQTEENADYTSLSPYTDKNDKSKLLTVDKEIMRLSDEDSDENEGLPPQCYICYETGNEDNPLINPCQCAGSVKYVHLSCLSRWIQPEGSSTVNTHCPVCKSK